MNMMNLDCCRHGPEKEDNDTEKSHWNEVHDLVKVRHMTASSSPIQNNKQTQDLFSLLRPSTWNRMF